MEVDLIKSAPRIVAKNNKSLRIQDYGDRNDYPQKIQEIVDASVTGKACVDIYSKFINGAGFLDGRLANLRINRTQDANDLLAAIAPDYAYFGGFVLHVSYNMLYDVTEIKHIPFEHMRYGSLDELGEFDKAAIHWDWGKRMERLRRFKKEDIDYIDLYTPDIDKIEKQVKSYKNGFYGFKGHVYVFSNKGWKTYPLPIFDSVVTDMRTEEAISNVVGRGAANNFLTAGMLIEILDDKVTEDQKKAKLENIRTFQGDKQAGQLLYMSVKSVDEIPKFESFRGESYDKEFTNSQNFIPDNIGRSFMQPPILRAKDVAGNLGAELIKNAYNFYNSITENERMNISSVMEELLRRWHMPIDWDIDYSIEPKSYNIGDSFLARYDYLTAREVIEIVANEDLSIPQKESILEVVYGISDVEIEKLFKHAKGNERTDNNA